MKELFKNKEIKFNRKNNDFMEHLQNVFIHNVFTKEQNNKTFSKCNLVCHYFG